MNSVAVQFVRLVIYCFYFAKNLVENGKNKRNIWWKTAFQAKTFGGD